MGDVSDDYGRRVGMALKAVRQRYSIVGLHSGVPAAWAVGTEESRVTSDLSDVWSGHLETLTSPVEQ